MQSSSSTSDLAVASDVPPRTNALPIERSPSPSSPPSSLSRAPLSSRFRPTFPRLTCSIDFRANVAVFSRLPALRRLRVLEVSYHVTCLLLACTLLSFLDSSPALLPLTAAYVLLTLLVVRSTLLLLLHLYTPSTLSYYHTHRQLRYWLRLLTLSVLVFEAQMLDWERLFGWEGEWWQLLQALVVLVELAVLAVQGVMICCMAVVLGRTKVYPLAPFMEVDTGEAPGLAPGRVRPVPVATAEELKAIPPLIFHGGLRCEKSCVICMADMVEGDEVRVLTCHHGFHATCLDEWLTRRQVCPLCVAGVDLPSHQAARREVESVEMAIRFSTSCE